MDTSVFEILVRLNFALAVVFLIPWGLKVLIEKEWTTHVVIVSKAQQNLCKWEAWTQTTHQFKLHEPEHVDGNILICSAGPLSKA